VSEPIVEGGPALVPRDEDLEAIADLIADELIRTLDSLAPQRVEAKR
jgi:hypothetical protein